MSDSRGTAVDLIDLDTGHVLRDVPVADAPPRATENYPGELAALRAAVEHMAKTCKCGAHQEITLESPSPGNPAHVHRDACDRGGEKNTAAEPDVVTVDELEQIAKRVLELGELEEQERDRRYHDECCE